MRIPSVAWRSPVRKISRGRFAARCVICKMTLAKSSPSFKSPHSNTPRDYEPTYGTLSLVAARQKIRVITMHQAGPFNPDFGAESFGLKDLKSISYNLQVPRLVEDAIRLGEALVAKGGDLSAQTGIHTGRSPNDKFTVRDALTDKTVWWDNNKAMTPQAFDTLYADMLAHAKGKELYAQDLYGGAWSAPTDGSNLYFCALTASKLAWAA